jgi:hypothetical protein
VQKFASRLKHLLSTIKGDNSNILSYNDFDDTWNIHVGNDGPCPLGEVDGNIQAEGKNLDELFTVLKIEIIKYNKGRL